MYWMDFHSSDLTAMLMVIFLSFPPSEFFFFGLVSFNKNRARLCRAMYVGSIPLNTSNSVGVHPQLSHNSLPMGVVLVAVD